MIKDFLFRSYSLLRLRTFKWFFCLTGPIISFVYILAVKPSGFNWFDIDEQIRLSLYFSIPTIFIWILHVFVLQRLIIKRLNILNTSLWLIWIHIVIGMYIYTFSEVYIFGSQFDWYFLPDILKMTFEMGAAVAFLVIIIHYGYLTRRRALNRKH